MLTLARVFLAVSSFVGGAAAIISGDWRPVLAAIALAVFGMFPVSILLMPGLLIFGALARGLGHRAHATTGPWVWVAAILGTANSSIIQVVWVVACTWIIGSARAGSALFWAVGLLIVGASYGVWEWLARKDVDAGNFSSTVQLSHYGVGLMLLWLTWILAPGAGFLALTLLIGAQLSAIPRIVDLARLEQLAGEIR